MSGTSELCSDISSLNHFCGMSSDQWHPRVLFSLSFPSTKGKLWGRGRSFRYSVPPKTDPFKLKLLHGLKWKTVKNRVCKNLQMGKLYLHILSSHHWSFYYHPLIHSLFKNSRFLPQCSRLRFAFPQMKMLVSIRTLNTGHCLWGLLNYLPFVILSNFAQWTLEAYALFFWLVWCLEHPFGFP